MYGSKQYARCDAKRHGAAVRAGVETIGERALVFVGGDYMHGFVKGLFSAGAAAGEFKERPLEATAPKSLSGSASSLLGCKPLYARVDFVPNAGEFELMELELIEPSLRARVLASGVSPRQPPDVARARAFVNHA